MQDMNIQTEFILTSDIHIVRSCEAHDNIIIATYLISALIDIT